ncbi:MAG: hypothetical protein ABTQ34_06155 [Bdellovibrionales bacterium]
MNEKLQKYRLLVLTILWPFVLAGISGIAMAVCGAMKNGSVGAENLKEGYCNGIAYGVSNFVSAFLAPILSIGEVAANQALWIPAGMIATLALVVVLDKILYWKSESLRAQVVTLVVLALMMLVYAASLPKAQENPLAMVAALLAMTGLSAILIGPGVFVVSGLRRRALALRGVFTLNMVLSLSLWLIISLRSFSY